MRGDRKPRGNVGVLVAVVRAVLRDGIICFNMEVFPSLYLKVKNHIKWYLVTTRKNKEDSCYKVALFIEGFRLPRLNH